MGSRQLCSSAEGRRRRRRREVLQRLKPWGRVLVPEVFLKVRPESLEKGELSCEKLGVCRSEHPVLDHRRGPYSGQRSTMRVRGLTLFNRV